MRIIKLNDFTLISYLLRFFRDRICGSLCILGKRRRPKLSRSALTPIFPWLTPSFSSAIARSAALRSLIKHFGFSLWHICLKSPESGVISGSSITRSALACVAICACLVLPNIAAAEDTAVDAPSHATATQSSSVGAGKDEALLRVIALRQELETQVKALTRLVAYQKELLALAKTSDVDAVLRARRQRQTCLAEINAIILCDALSVSFSDDGPDGPTLADDPALVDDLTVDDPTVQNRGDGG